MAPQRIIALPGCVTTMKVLVTGAAGFIGSHVCMRLLARGDAVVGIDNLNDYYDPALKEARLARFVARAVHAGPRRRGGPREHGRGVRGGTLPARRAPRRPGGRALLDRQPAGLHRHQHRRLHQHPRRLPARRGASTSSMPRSSSVYGAQHRACRSRCITTSTTRCSLYAATKKANELMAHTYSHLFGCRHGPALLHGLRSVGPARTWRCSSSRETSWRASRSTSSTTASTRATSPISTTSSKAWSARSTSVAEPDPDWTGDATRPGHPSAPVPPLQHRQQRRVELDALYRALEDASAGRRRSNLLPLQPGDVPDTFADVSDLMRDVGYAPKTTVDVGVRNFVSWYRDYYKV